MRYIRVDKRDVVNFEICPYLKSSVGIIWGYLDDKIKKEKKELTTIYWWKTIFLLSLVKTKYYLIIMGSTLRR